MSGSTHESDVLIVVLVFISVGIVFAGCLYTTRPKPMHCKTIHSFDAIVTRPGERTLVICDIDDTVLHHPMLNHDWMDVIQYYFFCVFQNDRSDGHLDSDEDEDLEPQKLPRDQVDAYMETLCRTTHPLQHTDAAGFEALVQRVEQLVFVTARSASTRAVTEDHLRAIRIAPEQHPLHFSDRIAKGVYIKERFHLTEFDRVVFIDDRMYNLDSVWATVKHPQLDLYLFHHRKPHPFEYYPLPPELAAKHRFDGELLVDLTASPNEGRCDSMSSSEDDTEWYEASAGYSVVAALPALAGEKEREADEEQPDVWIVDMEKENVQVFL
jgi:hypothetical protein